MSGLVDCIDQIAAQIRDGLETEVFGVQVETGWVFNPTPPTIDIYPGDPSRDTDSQAFSDEAGPYGGAYVFTVRTRLGTADTTEGQRLLLQFMDDESPLCVAGAVLSDPTLNGHAGGIHIRDVSGYRDYEGHLGFQFTVLALAAQS